MIANAPPILYSPSSMQESPGGPNLAGSPRISKLFVHASGKDRRVSNKTRYPWCSLILEIGTDSCFLFHLVSYSEVMHEVWHPRGARPHASPHHTDYARWM